MRLGNIVSEIQASTQAKSLSKIGRFFVIESLTFCLFCWGQVFKSTFCRRIFSHWLQKFHFCCTSFLQLLPKSWFQISFWSTLQSESWELSHEKFLIFLFFTRLLLEYFPLVASSCSALHVAAFVCLRQSLGAGLSNNTYKEASFSSPPALLPLLHMAAVTICQGEERQGKVLSNLLTWQTFCVDWILKVCTCWVLTRLC